MEDYRRTYCEIDIAALKNNMQAIRKKADQNAKLLAVVKADAYGHGAAPISKAIEGIVDYYGVATVNEGVELRDAGITKPIMVLGYCSPSQTDLILKYEIEPTVYDDQVAEKMSEIAVSRGGKVRVHIALDTGMTRIGLSADEKGVKDYKKIFALPGIEIVGLFTHFSCADMYDKEYTFKQMERYDTFVQMLKEAGLPDVTKHICNSAGIMEFDHHHYDMVRSGIITYGMYPSEEVDPSSIALEPILSWKTHVVNVMEPEMGRGISYGATYVTDHPIRIATVSIGYADGYPRSLSSKGWVLIHGKKAPILGRVCMDQMMVDITDIEDVAVEDLVTLIGTDGSERIYVEDIADLAGSFNYEFTCDISKRVPRIYINTEDDSER